MTPDDLRALRLAHHLTQGEVAELVHAASYRTVMQWETGKRPVPQAEAHLLCLLLGEAYPYRARPPSSPGSTFTA